MICNATSNEVQKPYSRQQQSCKSNEPPDSSTPFRFLSPHHQILGYPDFSTGFINCSFLLKAFLQLFPSLHNDYLQLFLHYLLLVWPLLYPLQLILYALRWCWTERRLRAADCTRRTLEVVVATGNLVRNKHFWWFR